MDSLFVYGTLRSTFDNPYARLLRAQADLVGPLTILGSICKIGEYTAYRPDGGGEVHGELWRLRNPEATFQVLDEYEGPDYERVLYDFGWIYQARLR